MVQQTKFRFSPRTNRAHLVQWREWGAAAFEEAARSDKLVALLITAFWCGVCQRLDETALSSDEVQLLLNAYFVPIRVEESRRPDVDLRYTHDGWPTLAHDILRMHLNPSGELVDISEPGPGALQRPLTALTQNAAAAMFFLRLAELRADPRLRDAAQWALLVYGRAWAHETV